MGKRTGKPLGNSFRGESRFVSERNRASFEEAVEEAARQAAIKYPENTHFDVHVDVKIRKHNQNVKVYGVNLTPKG